MRQPARQPRDRLAAMLRRCRAIIFDLDDTLVPTSKIDRAAILAAASGVERCAARFAELLKAEPFPAPDSSHDVPSWRSMLWARALASSEGSTYQSRVGWQGTRLGFCD